MGKGSKSKKAVEESESEVYHVGMQPPSPAFDPISYVLEVITKARVVVDSADESSDQEGDQSSSRRKKRKKKKGKKSEARWVSLLSFKPVIKTHMNN